MYFHFVIQNSNIICAIAYLGQDPCKHKNVTGYIEVNLSSENRIKWA